MVSIPMKFLVLSPFLLKKQIREDFKYYFADFVRKGGTPPPFTDKNFSEKRVTDLGGTLDRSQSLF